MEMTYRTDGSVYTRRANDTTRYYLHNLLVEDDKIRSYQFPNGRVTFPAATEGDPDPRPRFQYTLKDHLGNTVVLFEDRDGDGFINSSLADPATAEVLQRELYYPFGLPLRGTTPLWPNPSQDYLYNGKEDVWESGLLDYGFRQYSPEVGRFMGVDPIAEDFAWVSPYNYAENEPVGHIDLWGLQKVDIRNTRNSSGAIISRDVDVTINLKIINLTKFDNSMMVAARDQVASMGNSVFGVKGSASVVDSKTGRMTENKVPINIKVSISTTLVTSLSQINDADHVMMIIDKATNEGSSGNVSGRGQNPGNITIAEYQVNKLSFAELILHELGHNLGLDFYYNGGDEHTADGTGLMGSNLNGQRSVDSRALIEVFRLLGSEGIKNTTINHPNTKENARKFLFKNSIKYQQDKADSAGF